MKKDYDLLIIGGGSAGLTAARFARQLDLSVALVEQGRLGGDCTWSGCVPSKTLLRAAKSAQMIKDARRFGITASDPVIDFKSVMRRVDSVVQEIFAGESPDTLEADGIEVIQGTAKFIDSQRVSVAGKKISARRFLVCSGARPFIPPIDGLDQVDYLTYETVWGLEELPPRLAIIGGGPIGCELAQAFCRLGSSVTLVEAADRIMLQDEPEAAAMVAQRLTDEGVDLRLGAALERVEKTANGVRLTLGGEARVEANSVLVAVGRRPQVDGLGLDEATVTHGRGGIVVNKNLRTSRTNIFAAGERNAFLPFNKRSVLDRVPWATFTDPEVAHVGLSESQAKERHGERVMAATWPMEQTDRWLTEGDTPGFLKLVYLADGKLLGVTIVASRAGEMIQEWVLALDRGLKLSHMAESLHIYPTYSMAAQQLASKLRVDQLLSGTMGKFIRKYARMMG